MLDEQQRLRAVAHELGIDVRISQNGRFIDMEFANWHDSVQMRYHAFGMDLAPGDHRHTETFHEGDEAYRDAWLRSAEQTMLEHGFDFELEQAGNELTFRFESQMQHSLFVEMRDRGLFHQAAMRQIGARPALQPH